MVDLRRYPEFENFRKTFKEIVRIFATFRDIDELQRKIDTTRISEIYRAKAINQSDRPVGGTEEPQIDDLLEWKRCLGLASALKFGRERFKQENKLTGGIPQQP